MDAQSLKVGQKVQVLVAKYDIEGNCVTTQHPGPEGTVDGYYFSSAGHGTKLVVVDLGMNGLKTKMPGGVNTYTRILVVHPDNVVPV